MNGTEPQSYQEFESLPARVIGVLRSPRALFRSVIARPAWADVMAVTCAVLVGCGVTAVEVTTNSRHADLSPEQLADRAGRLRPAVDAVPVRGVG